MRCVIVIFCGIPASGKSTLVKQLEHYIEKGEAKDKKVGLVVELDAVYAAREAVGGNKDGVDGERASGGSSWRVREKWRTAREHSVNMVRGYVSEVCGTSGVDDVVHLILVDDVFQRRSMRKQYYYIAKEFDECGFVIVHVHAAIKECLQRNVRRTRTFAVSSESVVALCNTFECPCLGNVERRHSFCVVTDASFGESSCCAKSLSAGRCVTMTSLTRSQSTRNHSDGTSANSDQNQNQIQILNQNDDDKQEAEPSLWTAWLNTWQSGDVLPRMTQRMEQEQATQRKQDSAATRTNKLHQAELEARRIVGNIMQLDRGATPGLARALNQCKRQWVATSSTSGKQHQPFENMAQEIYERMKHNNKMR